MGYSWTREVWCGVCGHAVRFHSLGEIYYRNSDVCILVYDVTNSASLDKADVWYKELKSNLGDQVSILVVGNKIDNDAGRVISNENGQGFCDQRNCRFVEISCKTGDNIDRLTEMLGEMLSK